MAAPAHTFSLAASCINARMVLAVPTGTPSLHFPLASSPTQPQRIRFAAITTTTTTTTHRRIANWSDESAPVSEYFTGHTDEFGCPLGRTLTPYPARKVCGVDWTSMSAEEDDFEHEYGQGYEHQQEQAYEENAITPRRVTFAAGLGEHNVGSELVRVPTPYPRTGTTITNTTTNTTSTGVSGSEKKPFWRKWSTKLKQKFCPLKPSSSSAPRAEEERAPSPNNLRYECSMHAMFGEESAVYDGGV